MLAPLESLYYMDFLDDRAPHTESTRDAGTFLCLTTLFGGPLREWFRGLWKYEKIA